MRLPKKKVITPQPFRLLQVQWKGDRDLKTILLCESDAQRIIALDGKKLYCAIYLNELLQRLLPLDECFDDLFVAYEKSLLAMSQATSSQDIEATLRGFEFLLLKELGFGVNFCECMSSGVQVSATSSYCYRVGQGFRLLENDGQTDELIVQGLELIAISKNDYRKLSTLKLAKCIARLAFQALLADKPLKSRDLFL